jgi:tetratricopeptide (TPR) repeat protein
LAWHYELADLPEKAIGSRFAAGMRAAEISAYPEAFEHFGRARDLLEQVSDVDARLSSELDLHNALGGLLIATRGLASDEVVTTYRKAEQLLRAGKPSPAQSAMTLKGLWTFHNARAEYEAAARVGAELLELAGVLGTPEAMLLAYDCAGQTALLTGQFEDAVAYAARAERWLEPSLQRTLAARHGMDPGLALQSFACIADVQLGNLTRAQQRMNRILHSADALGFPGLQAAMHCQNAVLHFFIGSCGARPNELLDRCHRGAERALSIAQQFGFPFWEVLAGMVKIMAGALDGDATILAAGERAIAGWALSGARAACSWHSASLAVGQLAHGAFAAAMQNAEAALAHCTETGEGYGRSEAYRVLGLVLSDTDNPEVDVERAADCFEHALDTAHRQNAHWLELRGAHSFFKSLGSNDRARTDGALSAALEWFETRGEALETPLVADARRQLRRTR